MSFEEEMVYAYNWETVKQIQSKVYGVIFDLLFDLNEAELIYCANASEAEVLAGMITRDIKKRLTDTPHGLPPYADLKHAPSNQPYALNPSLRLADILCEKEASP